MLNWFGVGDAIAEDRKRLDESMVVGPGGTVAPRAWSGWRSGREVEERRQKRGEEEVCLFHWRRVYMLMIGSY